MSAIDHLLDLAVEYGRAAEVDTTTISWRLFGDSKKLGAIMRGADIQVRRLERAVGWFSDNWPDTAVWPDDVPRPLGRSDLRATGGNDDTPSDLPDPAVGVIPKQLAGDRP